MFGSHLSVSGGMHNAAAEARQLDMQTVQVFTKNQRQWTPPRLTDDAVRQWKAAVKEAGLVQPVSHDSYLINLASPDPDNLAKSISLFEDELQRCEALDIPWLVMHPGAHMGQGEEAGIKRVSQSFDQIHERLPGLRTVTLLEVTAGQGSTLGRTFQELRAIIDQVRQPERLAVCLDTAHLIESGYDLTSAKGAKATLQECEQVLGLDRVKVLHVNDSKTPRGSRVDRHAHIGTGHVAMDAFGVFMKAFRSIPKILETPKEDDKDGRPMDLVNIERLKSVS